MRVFFWTITVSALLAATAWAQQSGAQEEPELFAVWYTHYDCPEAAPGEAGSTPALAIDVDAFDEPYYSEVHDRSSDAEDAPPPAPGEFHCKYVRLSGFMQWMDYYHYRARFYRNATEAYLSDSPSYIVEDFVDPDARRGSLVQRPVTLVGRFYDLCGAAERAMHEARQTWWLFGPCHYGATNGMMLDNVVVERAEGVPRYILGEANRSFFDQLTRVRGPERDVLVERVRDWATLVREGPAAFAEDWIARRPRLSEHDRAEIRERLSDTDGYVSYLGQQQRMRQLNVRRAPVEVFQDAAEEDRDRAYGCICLVRSCAEQWPLLTNDVDEFLGDAACTELNRENGEWRWR